MRFETLETKENNAEIFKKYFLEGEYNNASIAAIPDCAMEYFEQKSKQFINLDDYKQNNFKNVFIINFSNGEKCFGVMQEKKYGTNNETEELIYIYEINEAGENIGCGEIRNNIVNSSDYFKHKPLVGFSRTETGFIKQGYGKRRLLLMNALSHVYFNSFLNSDTVISEQAKNVWEGLVKEGLAKKYKEGPNDRYCFVR